MHEGAKGPPPDPAGAWSDAVVDFFASASSELRMSGRRPRLAPLEDGLALVDEGGPASRWSSVIPQRVCARLEVEQLLRVPVSAAFMLRFM